MAIITNNYNKKYKTTLGGVKTIYLFDYVKYNRSQIKVSDMRLIEFPDTFIYKYNCKGTFNQSSEIEEGSIFINQTLNIQLSEVYDIVDLNKLLKGEFRIIAETNNGFYLLFGLRNGMNLKGSNSSGTNKNEFNGFNFDFDGKEKEYAPFSLDLDSLGFTSNETFNNYILQSNDNFILNG